jgi:putative resolvase
MRPLSAHNRRLVVLDDGEVDDDLVGDMVEVLTLFCAGLSAHACMGAGRRETER